MSLELIPVTLADANTFVERLHRHHKKVVGHKFSLGAELAGELVGVAIVGRPVARMRDDGWTLEVTRLCTNGTRNACSFLYGAARRAAFALGYRRLGTYLLASEDGASVRAAGWRMVGEVKGRSWSCPITAARGQASDRGQTPLRGRSMKEKLSADKEESVKTYYLHTINGYPAFYEAGTQICYAQFYGDGAMLATSLRQIRREQRLSSAWRKAQGYDYGMKDYGYKRIRVPPST